MGIKGGVAPVWFETLLEHQCYSATEHHQSNISCSRFLVHEKKKLRKVTEGLPQESGPMGKL